MLFSLYQGNLNYCISQTVTRKSDSISEHKSLADLLLSFRLEAFPFSFNTQKGMTTQLWRKEWNFIDNTKSKKDTIKWKSSSNGNLRSFCDISLDLSLAGLGSIEIALLLIIIFIKHREIRETCPKLHRKSVVETVIKPISLRVSV